MPKLRRKPLEIEAVQFNGSNFPEIGDFAGNAAEFDNGELRILVDGIPMPVNPMEWIIKTAECGFYLCSPAFFSAIYEPAAE